MLGKQKVMTRLHMTKQNVMTGCLLSEPQKVTMDQDVHRVEETAEEAWGMSLKLQIKASFTNILEMSPQVPYISMERGRQEFTLGGFFFCVYTQATQLHDADYHEVGDQSPDQETGKHNKLTSHPVSIVRT